MKVFDRIGAYSLALVVLLSLEGVCTLGKSFEFGTYTLIMWIFQVLLCIVFIWLAEHAIRSNPNKN